MSDGSEQARDLGEVLIIQVFDLWVDGDLIRRGGGLTRRAGGVRPHHEDARLPRSAEPVRISLRVLM